MEEWKGLQKAGIGRNPFQINGVTSRKGTVRKSKVVYGVQGVSS